MDTPFALRAHMLAQSDMEVFIGSKTQLTLNELAKGSSKPFPAVESPRCESPSPLDKKVRAIRWSTQQNRKLKLGCGRRLVASSNFI